MPDRNATTRVLSNTRALLELIETHPELGDIHGIHVDESSHRPADVEVSQFDPNRASALRAWATILTDPTFDTHGNTSMAIVRVTGQYGFLRVQVRSAWFSQPDLDLITEIPLGLDLLDELAGRSALAETRQ